MIPAQFIFLGIILQFIGVTFYIRSIIAGKTKPNLVSWTIWALAPFIGAYFQFKAGAGVSAIPVFMAGFNPFLIVIFCFLKKDAYWKLNYFDFVCGGFSLLSLFLYMVTHNLGISIFFAVFGDFLAGLPTYAKAWKFPETENGLLYLFAAVSNIIGLLTLSVWSFSSSFFGIYLVVQCLGILFCIYRKKIFPPRITQTSL